MHGDLAERIGGFNLLKDADGSTMPEPTTEELASVLVAHSPAPALDNVRVGCRAWGGSSRAKYLKPPRPGGGSRMGREASDGDPFPEVGYDLQGLRVIGDGMVCHAEDVKTNLTVSQ